MISVKQGRLVEDPEDMVKIAPCLWRAESECSAAGIGMGECLIDSRVQRWDIKREARLRVREVPGLSLRDATDDAEEAYKDRIAVVGWSRIKIMRHRRRKGFP